MEKVYADTNIIFDWLSERQPFFVHARLLFKEAETNRIEILVSTLSFMTTEYLLTKQIGRFNSLEALKGMRSICTVCNTGALELDKSLFSSFRDFEDALQYNTAINSSADKFITRNPKDFSESSIPIMTAEEFLKSR